MQHKYSILPNPVTQVSKGGFSCCRCHQPIKNGQPFKTIGKDGQPAPACLYCFRNVGWGLADGELEEPALPQPEADQLPPSGHTGAVNTECDAEEKEYPFTLTVDHLEVTFRDWDVPEVLELFTPDAAPLPWSDLPCGRHGYKSGKLRGNVRVYFDGAENMGVHVVCSGQGCRQLEAEGIVCQSLRWEGFLGLLANANVHVSRCDWALDDRQGMLDPETIERYQRAGNVVSRWRKTRAGARDESVQTGETLTGWSRYWGKPSSRIMLRIYDKRAETQEKGHQDPGHWMRVELQARDERATGLVKAFAKSGTEAVTGLLFGYLDFKEPGEDENKSRWKTAKWWLDFLTAVEKRRSTASADLRCLERAASWFRRQVAPVFALLAASPDHGQEWLDEQIAAGVSRMQSWHWQALGLLPKGGSLAAYDDGTACEAG